MERRDGQISAIAALDEPTRRGVYDHVVRQLAPVSRDEVAAALELPRATAAFHLDRLADEGLLDVIYQRRSGRTGPGAGRPAKLYQRSAQHVTVSLPPRRYDLAGRLLASALDHAERCGKSPREVLARNAYQLGRELADTARGSATDPDTRDTTVRALQDYGFEPRSQGNDVTLANCPFHTLAQEYPDIVCDMNLRLLEGLLDGLAPTGLVAYAHPDPTHCCVRLRQTP